MAYNTSEIRGEAQGSINFSNEVGGETLFRKIKDLITEEIRVRNIPANIREDVLKSGGIFGSRLPLLIISHPTNRFFYIGIYVNNSSVFFPLLGESAENTKANKKEYYQQNGNFIKAALTNPDEFKLQEEIQWQSAVLSCFNDNVN